MFRRDFLRITGVTATSLLLPSCVTIKNLFIQEIPKDLKSVPLPEFNEVRDYIQGLDAATRQELLECTEEYILFYKTLRPEEFIESDNEEQINLLLSLKFINLFKTYTPHLKYIDKKPLSPFIGRNKFWGKIKYQDKSLDEALQSTAKNFYIDEFFLNKNGTYDEKENNLLGESLNANLHVNFFVMVSEISHSISKDHSLKRASKFALDVLKHVRLHKNSKEAATENYLSSETLEFQAHYVTERATLTYLFLQSNSEYSFEFIFNRAFDLYEVLMDRKYEVISGERKGEILDQYIRPSKLEYILNPSEMHKILEKELEKRK